MDLLDEDGGDPFLLMEDPHRQAPSPFLVLILLSLTLSIICELFTSKVILFFLSKSSPISASQLQDVFYFERDKLFFPFKKHDYLFWAFFFWSSHLSQTDSEMQIFVKTLSRKTIHLGGRELGYYWQRQGKRFRKKRRWVLTMRIFDKRMDSKRDQFERGRPWDLE